MNACLTPTPIQGGGYGGSGGSRGGCIEYQKTEVKVPSLWSAVAQGVRLPLTPVSFCFTSSFVGRDNCLLPQKLCPLSKHRPRKGGVHTQRSNNSWGLLKREQKGNELGLCWLANRKNLDNRIHVRGGDRNLGVASTKVLKEVMKVNKQEKNSKPREIFRENGRALGIKAPRREAGSAGKDKKTHPLRVGRWQGCEHVPGWVKN